MNGEAFQDTGPGGRDARPPILKGWYRRGDQHPPHFDGGMIGQFITFRLADSLPQPLLCEWKRLLETRQIDEEEFHDRVESYLDGGAGECWLSRPAVASLTAGAFHYFDAERYDLGAFVMMPNHVHILICPRAMHRLPDIVHSWKSFTSMKANKLLERTGTFWQDDYFDRYIRDEGHRLRVIQYLLDNPVRANLCQRCELWPYQYVRKAC